MCELQNIKIPHYVHVRVRDRETAQEHGMSLYNSVSTA